MAELQRIELKSHETKFWRPQVDKPATYLSTIEAIYYCAREYYELTSGTEQYCRQYDDLLFFFIYFYQKILTVTAQRGRTLKAYTHLRAKKPRKLWLQCNLLFYWLVSISVNNIILLLFCGNLCLHARHYFSYRGHSNLPPKYALTSCLWNTSVQNDLNSWSIIILLSLTRRILLQFIASQDFLQ